jgi:hypothetical protein
VRASPVDRAAQQVARDEGVDDSADIGVGTNARR